MARYCDLDKLIKILEKSVESSSNSKDSNTGIVTNQEAIATGFIEVIKEIAQEIPLSIGSRPLIYTEWIEERVVYYNKGGKPYTSIYHRCKACGYRNKRSKGWNTNFCPNCGAERL